MNRIGSITKIKQYRPKPISNEAHQQLAKQLSLFAINNQQTHLKHTFKFDNSQYDAIVDKMARIGAIADQMDHHPEWTLSGDQLQIGLGTHEIGGKVSVKDYILASWIQHIWNEKPLQKVLIQEWNNRKIDISQIN